VWGYLVIDIEPAARAYPRRRQDFRTTAWPDVGFTHGGNGRDWEPCRVARFGGVSNLANRHYYSRVILFGGMLEPANDRGFYAGAAYDF